MDKNCTLYRTLGVLGKKWTPLVLLELYKGDSAWKRYSEVKNKLADITPKILSARLKELEAEGLVKKRVDAETFPIKSEYALTESGEKFIKILKNMK